MLLRRLSDERVLHLLLVSHLLHEGGYLLHGGVDLRHDALLPLERPLLGSVLNGADHIGLGVEPGAHVVLGLGPRLDFHVERGAQILVHLPQHLGGGVGTGLQTLFMAKLFLSEVD